MQTLTHISSDNNKKIISKTISARVFTTVDRQTSFTLRRRSQKILEARSDSATLISRMNLIIHYNLGVANQSETKSHIS